MKKIIFIGLLLAAPAALPAQTNGKLYYFDTDAVAVKTVYNAKNEMVARQEYKVKSTDPGAGKSAVIGQTITIKNGKESEATSSLFSCDASRLLISMGRTAEGAGVSIDYPLTMQAQQKIISSATFETETKIAGKTMKLYCRIDNRRISSTDEHIQTVFGALRCLKIEYDMELKGKVLGIGIPVTVHVVEWFAAGTGIVRTDIYRSGKLQERRVLTEIRKEN